MYYGWRKKIGIIFPSTATAPEVEFHRYAPQGVAILTQRVFFEKADPQGLIEMGDRAEEAAKILATAQPDLIVYACTAGTLIKGMGYDQEFTQRIEKVCGVKTLTTSTALLQALKAVNAKRLIVTTPYSSELNLIQKKFLSDSGFEVLAIEGLELTNPRMIAKVTIDQMYNLTKKTFNAEADTVFISCTGLGVLDMIEMTESDFKRPVLTSNQVTLWAALRTLGIYNKLPLGSLFEI